MGLRCCKSNKPNAVHTTDDVNKSNVGSSPSGQEKHANITGHASRDDQPSSSRMEKRRGSHSTKSPDSSEASYSSRGSRRNTAHTGIVPTHQKQKGKLKDQEVDRAIVEYEKRQLALAQNDRLTMVQHSHVELRQPVYFPPRQPGRPRTSHEFQLMQVPKLEPERETIMQQAQNKALEKKRKPSLAVESRRVNEVIKRESLAKAHIYQMLARKDSK